MTTEHMLQSSGTARLRVAIVAHDGARLAQWQSLVQHAGHLLVEPAAAQVVLTDVVDDSYASPTLRLVARPNGQNQLSSEAGARQIDAALRAIAAGLTITLGSTSQRRGFEELPESAIQGLLTPRELEVLNGIAAGQGNKAIARALGISLHTVKFHIESLLRKLGARTRAEAVAKALERKVRETIDL